MIKNATVDKVIIGYDTVWVSVNDIDGYSYSFNISKDRFCNIKVGGRIEATSKKLVFYSAPGKSQHLEIIEIVSSLNVEEPSETALTLLIRERNQYQEAISIAFEEAEKLQKIIDEDKRKLADLGNISKKQIDELKYKIENYEKREKISNLLTVIAAGLLVVVSLSCI